MGNDPFSNPSGGAKITDYAGKLILFTPTEYLESVPTVHGDKDAVQCDIVVLDAAGGPEEVEGIRIFQSVLIGELKPKVGRGMVLGVLGQRKATKKGQNDAWALSVASDAQKQAARDYLNAKDPYGV